MRRPTLCLLLSLCVLTLGSRARGQSAQSAQQPSTPAPQSSEVKASQQAQASDQPASQSPAKKVWTNEDVGELRDHSTISTVGTVNTKSPKYRVNERHTTPTKDSTWYRDQIRQLQKKLPALDAQIHDLKAGLNGEQVNSVRKIWGVPADDWRDQLARLQKQRDDILAKIDTLEDEARHNGVPPSTLP